MNMFDRKNFFAYLAVFVLIFGLFIFSAGCAQETNPDLEPEKEAPTEEVAIVGSIILATTTSTYDSGLLDYLNPVFTERTGIKVQVVSQGTGAALQSGARGDADVLLVHDRKSELALVEEGAFVERYDVMYNDFIIVGPADDPAGVMGVTSVVEALTLIAEAGETFISRGDDSGTHRMELRLWANAEIDPAGQGWYNAIGQGMSDALNMAGEKLGYTMTDRATYVANRNNPDLVIVLEGDPILFNQYGVMAVNPEKHPHVKFAYVMLYINFLMSDEGQDLINSFKINGETLFFPGDGLE